MNSLLNPTDALAIQRGLYDLSAVLARIYGSNIPDFLRSKQGLLAPFDKLDLDFSVAGDTAVAVPGVGTMQVKQLNELAGDFLMIDDSPLFTLLGIEAYIIFNQLQSDFTKAPLYLSAGKTWTTPFKGATIFYVQTAGKKARFLSSTGSRIQLSAQQISTIGSITGAVTLALATYATSFITTTNQVANTAVTIVAPGSNVAGINIVKAQGYHISAAGTGGPLTTVLAKSSVPLSNIDGDLINGLTVPTAATISILPDIPFPIKVSSIGKGLYKWNVLAETGNYLAVNYSL